MNQPPGGIMDFKIEKDIPIPVARNKNQPFPVSELETGDSFFIPLEYIENHYKNPDSVFSLFSVTGKRTGKKFTVRKMDGGYRVWRIK